MKAFWMFIKNTNDGTGDNEPAWPAGVKGQSVTPGDLIRLTGPTGPNAHRHLLVGGIALPDDNIVGIGAGHRHYLVKFGVGWQQITVGATNHAHTLPEDASGNLMPEYFLTFWAGSNADAATIAASPDCFPICEAVIGQDAEGNPEFEELDNTPWTAGELATWQARTLNLLGVTLPAEVDRGKRLVLLFLGALLARQMASEKGYRFAK